jgi:peroxiredoxin
MRAAKTDEQKKEMMATFEAEQRTMNEKMANYYKSDAGWEYQRKQTRDALRFSNDGTFRVEDIRPGKYLLRVDLREPGEEMNRFSARAIARLEKQIEVPAFDGERTDEPYNLGVIELAAKPIIKSGKSAPEFQAVTLDGKQIKLADFRGKYLLLDFWAVWCGPCVAETPHLKGAYEAFKDDPRFAMVGLSLDPEKEAPIDYQKKHDLGWIQGFLGEWSGTDIPNKFGVEGIPSIFLIGPDGKILETGLRGEQIKAAVQRALANVK